MNFDRYYEFIKMSSLETMISEKPFDLSTMKAIEDNVSAQKSGNAQYSFNANKALLKSYQCNGGDTIKPSFVIDVLVLGLMQMPATDFLELSYLIPSKLIASKKGDNDENNSVDVNAISLVMKLANLLEQSKYTEFWTEMTTNADTKASFTSINGFETAIRGYILANIAETFRNIKKSQLFSLLGYSNDEAAGLTFAQQSGKVETVQGDTVAFKQESNTRASKRSDLSANISDMLQLVENIRQNN